ncbi:MAG: hypothetical protein IPN34_09465 [Planctomycetes bacterium]|nr:hypothetical protein [Planctomycetota bacterium]
MANERPEDPDVLAVMRCRVFRGHQGRSLLLAVWIGMLATSLVVAAGVPPLLAPFLLLGILALAIGALAGAATYRLTSDGVQREHRRFLGGGGKVELAAFSDLRSYRHDRELSRSLEEYEYLELDRSSGPRWILTSRQDAEGFRRFRDAFLAVVAAPPAETQPSEPIPARAARSTPPLPRRHGFYQSSLGKLLALVFALASALLVFAAMLGALDPTALFRLAFVILPGTAYLLYRCFGSPRS